MRRNVGLLGPIGVILVMTLVGARGRSPRSAAQEPALTKGLALLAEIGGPATAVAADAEYAYLALGRRLLVLSYSASAAPVVIGETAAVAVEPRQIVLHGTIAYLVDPFSGVHVIDVTDRQRPHYLRTVRCGDQAMGLAVAGGRGYLACGQAGLVVLDLAQPREPMVVAELPTPRFARAVAVLGRYALIAERDAWVSGLWVVDIGDPAQPLDRGFLLTPGGADHVAVVEDTAFVLGASGSLWVVDVADPQHPTRLGHAELGQAQSTIPGYPASGEQSYRLWATGDFLYVAQGERGLIVVDVRYRRRPLAFDPYDTPGQARDVLVIGRRPLALVADGVGGLRVIALDSLANPKELYAYDESPGAVRDVTAGDGYLCLVSQVGGLWAGSSTMVDVADLSVPDRPRLRGTIELPGAVRSVAAGASARGASTCAVAQYPRARYEVERGRSRVVYEGGLQLVDASQPAAPRVTAAWHGAYLINVSFGKNVFYGAWSAGYSPLAVDPHQVLPNGLVVIDDRRLHNLGEMGRLATSGQARWVTARGDTAYLAAYDAGLHIISVSDPERPQLLSSLPLDDRARGVAVVDGVALVATETQGLAVVDVTDPTLPGVIGRIALVGGGRKVEVAGDYAVVTDGEMGVNLIDVSNPRQPQWRDRYAPPFASVNAVAASLRGEFVYVGVDPGSLLVLGIVDKPYPTPTTTPPTPRPTPTREPTLTPSPTLEATLELTPTEEATPTATEPPPPAVRYVPWLGRGESD